MTNETVHDFTREARFQRRIDGQRTATIVLFPGSPDPCRCLWDEEEACDLPVMAIVKDDAEFLDDRPLCDVHLLMHLGDVIPLVYNLEQAARRTG